MLRQSFILFPKISNKLEHKIWSQGIKDWNDFLKADKIVGLSKKRKIFYDRFIENAKQQFIQQNALFFDKQLKGIENYRLYEQYKDEAVFLDIESNEAGRITIIGLYDGFEVKTMVQGINLDEKILSEELSKYKLLITFNGKSFDIPRLKKYFKSIPDLPHIDIRHICSKVGLTGGLKEIERELGIKRPEIVEDMYGGDAILLWRKFLATGNKRFLDLLIDYNSEDIINLKTIADYSIKALWNQTTSASSIGES